MSENSDIVIVPKHIEKLAQQVSLLTNSELAQFFNAFTARFIQQRGVNASIPCDNTESLNGLIAQEFVDCTRKLARVARQSPVSSQEPRLHVN